MQNNNESQDTPEIFLSNLGEVLQNQEGVDTDLTEILRKYILITSPGKDAVTAAKNAIIELAKERVKPREIGEQHE